MISIQFYRDSDGAARASGEDTRPLAQFLESDIQEDIETCDELIAILADPDPEVRRHYDFVGNSFAMSFDEDEVVLLCHALEESDETRLRRRTVLAALQEWKAFIMQD